MSTFQDKSSPFPVNSTSCKTLSNNLQFGNLPSQILCLIFCELQEIKGSFKEFPASLTVTMAQHLNPGFEFLLLSALMHSNKPSMIGCYGPCGCHNGPEEFQHELHADWTFQILQKKI